MIVLDTNVLSELMRAAPAEAVVAWFSRHPAATLYTTTITQAEILHGVLRLPAGKRRTALADAAEAMFAEDFRDRVLSFDTHAASAYAAIVTSRERAGMPISTFDAQIAAIARVARASVATRNVRDFDGCGVEVVDPWAE